MGIRELRAPIKGRLPMDGNGPDEHDRDREAEAC
jgi:hypothetical protein